MASIAALAESLKTTFADKVVELVDANGELTLVVRAADLLSVSDALRDLPTLKFEQLIDLCGLDYRDYGNGRHQGLRYAVVYQPVSIEPRETVPRVVREAHYGDVE